MKLKHLQSSWKKFVSSWLLFALASCAVPVGPHSVQAVRLRKLAAALEKQVSDSLSSAGFVSASEMEVRVQSERELDPDLIAVWNTTNSARESESHRQVIQVTMHIHPESQGIEVRIRIFARVSIEVVNSVKAAIEKTIRQNGLGNAHISFTTVQEVP